MASGTEIERKFVLPGLPPGLAYARREAIRQGYIALDGDTEVRVRLTPRACTLTIKRGHGQTRIEEEIALERARADALWELTEGRRVEKIRRRMRADGVEIEVDEYSGSLDGLVVAEIEFDDEDAAMDFRPPPWLGREVTGQDAYSNRELSQHGLPED
ncbi:MAG: adenylate cyclase [Solirubrobacteraceae bacterium]|jgi:CYTH domain-containing protein|nr:adenylate cyclase [Solirubrobacteraceae bacterium]